MPGWTADGRRHTFGPPPAESRSLTSQVGYPGRQCLGRLSASPQVRPDAYTEEFAMPYAVDFGTVSTVGLESSPVAPPLWGLRANEAR